MDAKANTHFCESPLNASRADSALANRQSAYLIVIRGGIPGTMLRIGPDETTWAAPARIPSRWMT